MPILDTPPVFRSLPIHQILENEYVESKVVKDRHATINICHKENTTHLTPLREQFDVSVKIHKALSSVKDSIKNQELIDMISFILLEENLRRIENSVPRLRAPSPK